MTNSTYHVIQTSGEVATAEWKMPLQYKCPRFEDIRAALGFKPNTMLEHVNVLWKGRPAHMFVDEMGLLKGLPINGKATRVYWNATLNNNGEKGIVYRDLSMPAVLPREEALTLERLDLVDYRIVGPAFLWEGEME